VFDQRKWYFFFQKISLGKNERYFIYLLIGVLVSIEAVHQSSILSWKPPVYDYNPLDSLIEIRTAAMQADYDSVLKFQYQPDVESLAEMNELKELQKKTTVLSKRTEKKTTVKKPVKININTATLSEWIQVPGIGEKTAQIILDYRLKEGSFASVEDLTKVKGIGPKKLEKLREFLIVE
jgi:competence protein ComEA